MRALLLSLLLVAAPSWAQSRSFWVSSSSSGGAGGSSYITSLGAVGSSPNDNACSVDGSGVFQMQPASSTKPGVLTIGAQDIPGAKRFKAAATFDSTVAATGAVTGSNLSGTNTGDVPTPRWLFTLFNFGAGSAQANTAGRAIGAEFQPLTPCTAEGISYEVAGTNSSNVRVGLYGPASSPETMTGAALLAESADVAQAGTNTNQYIPFASTTTLVAGSMYYAAIQFSSASGSFQRMSSLPSVPGFVSYYDRSGGYGAFTNPAPTTTNPTTVFIPTLKVRCQ